MARQTDTDERGSVHGVNPGTELGRYTVGTRIEEIRGGERWMARDTTLDRDVSLLVMPAGTDSTAAALDAARRAAGVEAAQLVRILDVGTESEISFIAEDGVSGARSLAETIGRDGLPAEEVRRITGEVATGIESARTRGLHHLALTPDNVLLTSDGRVKVRGLATTAALAGVETEGEEADRQDAAAVVALAYAGLTATWPLPGRTSLPAAPDVGSDLPAPSRVAVGVPGDLDTICRETLVEGTGPDSPGDYAAQIAPWSRIPLAGAMRTAGTPSSAGEKPDTQPGTEAPADKGAKGSTPTAGAGGKTADDETREIPRADDTGVMPTAGAAAPAGSGAGPTGGEDGSDAGNDESSWDAGTREGQTKAAVAAAAAAGAGAVGTGGKVIGERLGKAAKTAGDRSREAIHDARLRREAIRADQRARTSLGAAPVSAEVEPPAPMLPADSGGPPSRRQSNLVVLLMTAVVLVACMVGSYGLTTIGDGSDLGKILSGNDKQVIPTPSPSKSSDSGGDGDGGSDSGSDEPLGIINAAGYDPFGDGVEHNAEAPRVYDGSPDTVWETEGYATPDFGGIKQGVGITVDLGQQKEVSSVTLNLPTTADATVYVDDQPTSSGTVLGRTNQSGEVTLEADQPIQGRYVTVWFTSLSPSIDGRHRAALAEITVR